ncbi:saccharopine dehydrogenase NADP-binding domain-containing protein [Halobellus ruber]|uniref:Saccharopine dehydrogenase NADP-binding domain-containing protein n=1 Tax=Halobellus ruber TaxID=2761102 RepID=A0A7J9SDA7_9EURY|nr:saccharopine dehydrogenase NADP-binding domain-containing protein [Halobellus ruber]
MSSTPTNYDIVVWGATGFAGQLVAKHLTSHYPAAELSVALGGRNESQLRRLAEELTDESDREQIAVVVGDATDPASLGKIAGQTKVICTTVGPYTTYGTPLVEACIEAETDYCDLTGEINWVREMIDRYHDDAVAADVKIVHSCGFDSIPSDLGVNLLQSYATEEFGDACEFVRIYLEEGEGGVSGGTLASAAELFEAAATDPIARETVSNPYSLAPPGERCGVDTGEQRRPQRDSIRSIWTAPSPMAAVNERVIRRSNALLEYPWGREFRCTEVIPTGSGIGGAAAAGGIALGLGVGTAAMKSRVLRRGLRRFVFPEPGTGPSEAKRKSGHFLVRVIGRGTTTDGPFTVASEIGAELDPGYGATARMLGEAGMCLLRGETESPLDGGILTPASGIGDPLGDRLRDVGFTVTAGGWQ